MGRSCLHKGSRLLTVLLMLSLAGAGCGERRQEDNPDRASQTGETETVSMTGVLQYGYFHEEDGILLSTGERFLYSDWEPAEFDYICTDPTCSHRTSGCSARTLSKEGQLRNDFSLLYQDHLIIVHAVDELEEAGSVPAGEDTGVTVMDSSYLYSTEIYEADPDGGNRRKKAVFPGAIKYVNGTHAAILVGDKLYFGGPLRNLLRWEYEAGAESGDQGVFREWTDDAVYCLDLNDYTLETFAVTENREGGAYQYEFYEYDGMIYAIISNFQDDCAVWYRIDPAAGVCEEIRRFDSDAARFQGAIGDTVYYCYEKSGQTLYARDIAPEAEEREIMTVSGEDMRASAFVLDDRILLQTDRVLEGDDRMSEYAVLDRDGNLVDTIRYDEYITFFGVLGDKILYYRLGSDFEEWWADQADLAELDDKGVEVGPFFGVKLDTLAD